MLTVDGLISGLDTTALIEQLLQLERRPVGIIAGQVQVARERQTAFLDLSARLLNLQLSSRQLADGDAFATCPIREEMRLIPEPPEIGNSGRSGRVAASKGRQGNGGDISDAIPRRHWCRHNPDLTRIFDTQEFLHILFKNFLGIMIRVDGDRIHKYITPYTVTQNATYLL